MTPAELRSIVFERDGHRCQWPGCDFEIDQWNPLECAHFQHRGMGGSEEANRPDNAVTLCRLHHLVLDGRQGQAKERAEKVRMLKTWVGI